MKVLLALALLVSTLTVGMKPTPAAAEARCRLEQQCRWVNFKKICTYVRVCR